MGIFISTWSSVGCLSAGHPSHAWSVAHGVHIGLHHAACHDGPDIPGILKGGRRDGTSFSARLWHCLQLGEIL